MLCLSGFELCSRWVPLFLDEVGGKRFLRTLRGDTVAYMGVSPGVFSLFQEVRNPT